MISIVARLPAAESRPLLMLGYWQRQQRAVMRVSRGRGGVDG